MQSGFLSLHPLYDLLASDPDLEGLRRGSPARRHYGLKATDICKDIAPLQGFYLWGRYESNGLWRNIYLGRAGFGKTAHLRARILEELKDEGASIWLSFVSEDTLREASKRNHPTMWQKYQAHLARTLKKARATHIAWVADPDLEDSAVQDIESDLIETLNPRANILHPVPSVILQKHTKEIIGEFRYLIHDHRRDRYTIPVPQVG
jgi:hypothetical protein